MPLIHMKSVADEVGVSVHTVRHWVRTGFIPHVRAGRLIRFDMTVVRDWLSRRSHPGRDTLTPHIH